MNHKWIKRPFQPSKTFVEEVCVCGALSRKTLGVNSYTFHTRLFMQSDGTWGLKKTPCTRLTSKI
jgi:hypothetical protein